MRIKVIYHKERGLLKVPAILKIPHKRIVSNFVIDTGSPHTILNYTDSIRLNVPRSKKSEIMRIGGKIYQSFLFSKFEIVFKSLDNKEIKEIIPIRILKPMSQKISEIEELDRLPNLLGLDLLKKYKFVCDILNNEIYLEKGLAENQ